MSGRCLIGSRRPLSEKPGHEGRADRQYIPTQAMHGINRGGTSPSVQKGTPEPIIGTARAQLRKAENLTKALYFQKHRGADTRRRAQAQTAANVASGDPESVRTRWSEQFGTDADRSTCLASFMGKAHASKSR